ncbi:terpenoid synthase [Gloeophyllum trabeum ATCC 11539]|uniref:Terpene synthase n=1 Tax=Gloeophyllum trabeum (strain ATCC 11539 / FP-39264 / Madison 617) TaxID=670483 RepID=S7Q0L2_GLOTA|nr:terpenoid synthase [Gloeophyllum trabeum ATCC 11539]EPQ53471.1 terpenoid synthase [Gloeophyllum trabeum ATCC 11539]
MSTVKTGFYLPDGLAKWPWTRQLNPNYPVVKAESQAWLEAFGAMDDHAQRSFNKCDFSLLACLAYPLEDKDEKGVRAQADAILDALHHPHTARPADESILGEVARQFWERAILTMSQNSQKRFLEVFGPHANSMVQQAKDRGRRYRDRRSIDSYLSVRRGTIAAKLAFAILEADLDLPNKVKEHPLIVELELCCMDMLILSNDMYSYNVEQAKGDDGHNIVTVVMHEKHTDIDGAMEWVGGHYRHITTQFLEDRDKIPSWARGHEIDAQVSRYIEGLGHWARGHDQWCFETERYFGKDGLETQEKRWVELM